MDAQQAFFLTEKLNLRVNLSYIAFLFIFYNSWVSSGSWIGFVFYALYFTFQVLLLALVSVVGFAAYMFLTSQRDGGAVAADTDKFYKFNDRALESEFRGKKMPMETWVEAYVDGKVDLNDNVDLWEMLKENRRDLFRFNFTKGHIEFFLRKFVAQLAMHSKRWDFMDVATTYNRGNDFYHAFLGDAMVYTSGIFNNEDDTLEQAQVNKMNLVARKIGMKPGDRHLDIGCGWGTFVIHCAREFGTNSYGITIAEEQVAYGNEQVKNGAAGDGDAADRIKLEYRDYRDLVTTKYDKITALEMAEHVGVKNYQAFLRQIYDLLEDDGLFYIQVCGLRPSWQFEDFVWGLFMAKYIFPAADASCPANWVASQLEQAGFEIHSLENVSTHYVQTIYLWYVNFKTNYEEMEEKYGQRLCRIWLVFLAWSTLIGAQGSSACMQFVCHKNLDDYDRSQWRTNDLSNYYLRQLESQN